MGFRIKIKGDSKPAESGLCGVNVHMPDKEENTVKRKKDCLTGAQGSIEKSFAEKYFLKFMRCMRQDIGQTGLEKKTGAVDRSCLSCRYVGISGKNGIGR